jgi:hypothetical protein
MEDDDKEILSFNVPDAPQEEVTPVAPVVEEEETEEAGVGEVSEEEHIIYSDHDEEKISKLYDGGKKHITASELITAGVTSSRISPHKFRIGRFLLAREWLISPYKITKVI